MSRSSGRQASRQAARNDRVLAATKHLGRWNESSDGGLGSYAVAKKHDDGHHGSGERLDRGADAPKVPRGMYADGGGQMIGHRQRIDDAHPDVILAGGKSKQAGPKTRDVVRNLDGSYFAGKPEKVKGSFRKFIEHEGSDYDTKWQGTKEYRDSDFADNYSKYFNSMSPQKGEHNDAADLYGVVDHSDTGHYDSRGAWSTRASAGGERYVATEDVPWFEELSGDRQEQMTHRTFRPITTYEGEDDNDNYLGKDASGKKLYGGSFTEQEINDRREDAKRAAIRNAAGKTAGGNVVMVRSRRYDGESGSTALDDRIREDVWRPLLKGSEAAKQRMTYLRSKRAQHVRY